MSKPNVFLRPLALGKALRGSLGIAHYVFAFVFLVRLIDLFRLAASPVLFPSGSDMQFYDDWAKQILHGHWTDYRAFYGLPAYPFLVALVYRVFGYSPFVPGFFQACLDAGTAALIYKITFQLLTGAPRVSGKAANTAAVLVAAAWCFYVPAQAYSAHGGITLWLGNTPEATGYPRFPGLRAGQGQMLRDSIEQAEAAAGRPLKRSEVSRYWSVKARNYIAQHPAAWLKLLGRKVGNF